MQVPSRYEHIVVLSTSYWAKIECHLKTFLKWNCVSNVELQAEVKKQRSSHGIQTWYVSHKLKNKTSTVSHKVWRKKGLAEAAATTAYGRFRKASIRPQIEEQSLHVLIIISTHGIVNKESEF
ncbi:AIF_HP2_G0052430.mRNA.1.CDS.1 [Saccharomyces cerevisiae]|nr:AIF_HP2_G0052430.mRNA.1.CDS.1 [Saccharomyces cerevisiae]CAI6798627.1 AIF_HP2_G0052430.mRNA.1.CDS.1 [Saccharomyces cerevisiae]